MATPSAPANETKVESYQKVASIGGWAGAGRTLWAISTIGAVVGSAIGLAAPFFPMLALGAAALPSLATLGSSAAIFSATGISMGFAGGLMLGRISGTAAAIAEESERRSKEWTIKQMKGIDPNYQPVPDEPKKSEAPAPTTLGGKLRKLYYDYVNPRVGLTMIGIGIVGGLIMGAAFIASGGAASFAIMPALHALMGSAAIAAHPGAVLAYTTGVSACFAATWCLNMPKITSNVTAMYGKLISGEPLGRKWGEEPGKAQTITPPAAPERAPEAPQLAMHEPESARSFGNYRELVARQAQSASNHMAKG